MSYPSLSVFPHVASVNFPSLMILTFIWYWHSVNLFLLCYSNVTGVGKNRFTVVSMWNSLSYYYLLIIVLFSIWTTVQLRCPPLPCLMSLIIIKLLSLTFLPGSLCWWTVCLWKVIWSHMSLCVCLCGTDDYTEDIAMFANSWLVQTPDDAKCVPTPSDFPNPCSSGMPAFEVNLV